MPFFGWQQAGHEFGDVAIGKDELRVCVGAIGHPTYLLPLQPVVEAAVADGGFLQVTIDNERERPRCTGSEEDAKDLRMTENRRLSEYFSRL